MLEILRQYFYKRFKTSFSKSGEDIQLWQLLKKEKGTYIDIGGHHPKIGNNSYFFYLRGWRGLIVEPNPFFKNLYHQIRPKDHLFQGGVADFDGNMKYYIQQSNLLNTFSEQYLIENNLLESTTEIRDVPVRKLSSLLEDVNLAGKEIDFMSIDVEGLEFEVASGNNWEKSRPKYLLFESSNALEFDMESNLTLYLKEREYQLVGKSLLSQKVGTIWFRANEVK